MADPEGTRKLEAILVADVAGYSRLMQEDDEATVATLEAYRAVFRRPWVALWLGDSYYWLRRYDEAIAAYQEAIRRNPNYLTARRDLAATYAEMGREKEAQAEAAEVLRLNPAFSVELFRARHPVQKQADLDRLIVALRKAGLK